jgi:hypothetical protein
MNPYAQHLGDRDPFEVIAGTPDRLAGVVQSLGPDGMEQSLGPDKWKGREILCHLADCEIVFAVRLRQTLAEPHHMIQPFDQEIWSHSYGAYPDGRSALDVFTAVRRWNIALLKSTPADLHSKAVTHPERGTMTFLTIIETMAGHDLNHLAQFEQLRSSATGAR